MSTLIVNDPTYGIDLPVCSSLDEAFKSLEGQANGRPVVMGNATQVLVTLPDGSKAMGWRLLEYYQQAGEVPNDS